jgi:hypothetical protein
MLCNPLICSVLVQEHNSWLRCIPRLSSATCGAPSSPVIELVPRPLIRLGPPSSLLRYADLGVKLLSITCHLINFTSYLHQHSHAIYCIHFKLQVVLFFCKYIYSCYTSRYSLYLIYISLEWMEE